MCLWLVIFLVTGLLPCVIYNWDELHEIHLPFTCHWWSCLRVKLAVVQARRVGTSSCGLVSFSRLYLEVLFAWLEIIPKHGCPALFSWCQKVPWKKIVIDIRLFFLRTIILSWVLNKWSDAGFADIFIYSLCFEEIPLQYRSTRVTYERGAPTIR